MVSTARRQWWNHHTKISRTRGSASIPTASSGVSRDQTDTLKSCPRCKNTRSPSKHRQKCSPGDCRATYGCGVAPSQRSRNEARWQQLASKEIAASVGLTFGSWHRQARARGALGAKPVKNKYPCQARSFPTIWKIL